MAKESNKHPRRSSERRQQPRAAAGTGQPVTPRSARRPESVRRRKEERQKAIERERRNRMLLRIGAIAIGALLLAVVAVPIVNRFLGPDVSADVTTYFGPDDFVGNHPGNVSEILYEQVPPVGGPHNAIWQNCGFYDEYIFNWHGVHALEHGAVWLTYDPNLPEEDKQKLEEIADQSYVLASPYPGLDAPVVGSVWGKQIKFDSVDTDRINAFIEEYKRNPGNTPEPNAVCWSGTSLTTDQEPQQQPYQRAQGTAPIGGVTITDATATAAAQQGAATTPAASPAASPQATPEASPVREVSPAA